MNDSKVSPIAVLSDRKCRLIKSWSCRNSLPVPVLTVGASTMVFTCFWWMNLGLCTFAEDILLLPDRYLLNVTSLELPSLPVLFRPASMLNFGLHAVS